MSLPRLILPDSEKETVEAGVFGVGVWRQLAAQLKRAGGGALRRILEYKGMEVHVEARGETGLVRVTNGPWGATHLLSSGKPIGVNGCSTTPLEGKFTRWDAYNDLPWKGDWRYAGATFSVQQVTENNAHVGVNLTVRGGAGVWSSGVLTISEEEFQTHNEVSVRPAGKGEYIALLQKPYDEEKKSISAIIVPRRGQVERTTVSSPDGDPRIRLIYSSASGAYAAGVRLEYVTDYSEEWNDYYIKKNDLIAYTSSGRFFTSHSFINVGPFGGDSTSTYAADGAVIRLDYHPETSAHNESGGLWLTGRLDVSCQVMTDTVISSGVTLTSTIGQSYYVTSMGIASSIGGGENTLTFADVISTQGHLSGVSTSAIVADVAPGWARVTWRVDETDIVLTEKALNYHEHSFVGQNGVRQYVHHTDRFDAYSLFSRVFFRKKKYAIAHVTSFVIRMLAASDMGDHLYGNTEKEDIFRFITTSGEMKDIAVELQVSPTALERFRLSYFFDTEDELLVSSSSHAYVINTATAKVELLTSDMKLPTPFSDFIGCTSLATGLIALFTKGGELYVYFKNGIEGVQNSHKVVFESDPPSRMASSTFCHVSGGASNIALYSYGAWLGEDRLAWLKITTSWDEVLRVIVVKGKTGYVGDGAALGFTSFTPRPPASF